MGTVTLSTRYLLAAALVGAAQVCSADALSDLRACVAERDDARRLACFDSHIKQTMPAAQTPVQAAHPAAATAPAPATTESAESSFGMTPVLQQKENPDPAAKPLERLTRRVVSVAHQGRGELVIGLDNGQVWQQAETEEGVATRVDPGDTVTIRSGSLGSFWLSTAHRTGFRVRRIH